MSTEDGLRKAAQIVRNTCDLWNTSTPKAIRNQIINEIESEIAESANQCPLCNGARGYAVRNCARKWQQIPCELCTAGE